MLRGACNDQVRLFRDVFPEGGVWPRDAEKAAAAGLEVSWLIKNRGLLPLITDELAA